MKVSTAIAKVCHELPSELEEEIIIPNEDRTAFADTARDLAHNLRQILLENGDREMTGEDLLEMRMQYMTLSALTGGAFSNMAMDETDLMFDEDIAAAFNASFERISMLIDIFSQRIEALSLEI